MHPSAAAATRGQQPGVGGGGSGGDGAPVIPRGYPTSGGGRPSPFYGDGGMSRGFAEEGIDATGGDYEDDNDDLYEEIDLGTSISYELHRSAKRPSLPHAVTPYSAAGTSGSSLARILASSSSSSAVSTSATPQLALGGRSAATGIQLGDLFTWRPPPSPPPTSPAAAASSPNPSTAEPMSARATGGSPPGAALVALSRSSSSFASLQRPRHSISGGRTGTGTAFAPATQSPADSALASNADVDADAGSRNGGSAAPGGAVRAAAAFAFTPALRHSPLRADAELRALAQQIMHLTHQLKLDGDLLPWDFADLLMNADSLIHAMVVSTAATQTPLQTQQPQAQVQVQHPPPTQDSAPVEVVVDAQHQQQQPPQPLQAPPPNPPSPVSPPAASEDAPNKPSDRPDPLSLSASSPTPTTSHPSVANVPDSALPGAEATLPLAPPPPPPLPVAGPPLDSAAAAITTTTTTTTTELSKPLPPPPTAASTLPQPPAPKPATTAATAKRLGSRLRRLLFPGAASASSSSTAAAAASLASGASRAWARDVAHVSVAFLQSAAAFPCGSDERRRRIQDALDFHRLLLECYEQSPARARRFLAKLQGGWYRKDASMEQLLSDTK
ncbi:hypothetical protein HK405_014834 [Cladochytrium tenue]|nr:hypothetical protein HK405_014834 [Cladochytrium tenue]